MTPDTRIAAATKILENIEADFARVDLELRELGQVGPLERSYAKLLGDMVADIEGKVKYSKRALEA